MAEKRIDPFDGCAYTFPELSSYYKMRYKQWEIDAYWEKCKKKAAGRSKLRGDNGHVVPKKRHRCIEKKSIGLFDALFVRENCGSIYDHYEIEKNQIWGEGTFGQVVIGTMKTPDMFPSQPCRAIKCIGKAGIPTGRLQLEIDILRKMRHVNIVRLYETFEDARMKYLVMELCEGDELFTYIQTYCLSEEDSSRCLGQVLDAIHYMHSQNIVHRDIKPENVLLAKAWEDDAYPIVKLVDFGAARHYKVGSGRRMKTICGTTEYMSPQHFRGKGYDEKCDVWSCGVLAYEMLSGGVPFFAATEGESKRKIRNGSFNFPDDEWEGIGCEAKDMIKSMLAYDDTNRPSVNNLLQHAWITSFRTLSDTALPDNLYDRMRRFHEASKLKRVALSVIAQQICDDSDADILKQTFQALDSDRDGVITAEEMVSVFKKEKAGEGEDYFLLGDKPHFEDVIRSCDTSENQQIDITEFLAATMEKHSYDRNSVLWVAFRTFDIDQDGTISKKDLAELLRETDINSPIVETIFAEAAIDEDKKDLGIDFEVFQRAVSAEGRARKFTQLHEG